jgi:formamidopyrimidine-DNA glycosylase
MPELPEVETIRRGIKPHVVGKKITDVIIRDRRLRRPVPKGLEKKLMGRKLRDLERRAKYLVFHFDRGALILHLGMTGSLRILTGDMPPAKHDHADFVFSGKTRLRFRDPRRFGCILWTEGDPLQHELLRNLGPEPLGKGLTGTYLFAKSRKRVQAIKSFLMDSRIISGIGNIYANEALFSAGIHPGKRAGRLTKSQCATLAAGIKKVLTRAIAKGGTTLRDYVNGKGEPGYFRLELKVYDRKGQPCYRCGSLIKSQRHGQRSSFYCPTCQNQ